MILDPSGVLNKVTGPTHLDFKSEKPVFYHVMFEFIK